ncbi:glycosyltransferase family 2 protein [Sphingobacterium siyangense]|uniref:glycosyltransferase family 2 protein n=1 Tax=Sphingobacterium siyangense TaxID=459529 RepID=UPI003DA62626
MPAKISILMPIYNGAIFLQEALDSIWQQTFQDFELIIVDDGSTDDTAKIIFEKNDQRLRYFKNEKNLGIIETLNRGLEYCQGKYIARMDADDIAFNNRLELQYNYMEKNPETVLCGSSIIKFSQTYSFKDFRGGNDDKIKAKLVFDTAINHPSAIFRNDIIKKHNLRYQNEYPHAEDYFFWYELSQYGKVANLEEILLKYRMHGNNVSMKFNVQQYNTMNLIRSKILGDFWNNNSLQSIYWMRSFNMLLQKTNVTIGDLKEMDLLLMTFVNQNKINQRYHQHYLEKSAAWYWYVVYLHENCYQYSLNMIVKFLFNKRSIVKFLDWKYKRKFLVKALLCWKKKGINHGG